jgi:hypothetical protein
MEAAMIITYCETCGARVKMAKVADTVQCEDCKSGKPAPRRQRDSGHIPRSKLDQMKLQQEKARGKGK